MDQDRSPFDLPELMMIIGRFMDKKVLAACVLVSKAWYKTFAPFLWETIKLQERRRYRSKDAPLDGFRNTRNWIRSVHIDFHRPTKLYWNEMPILPNLKVLKTQTMYTSDQRHITSMLTQHPLITHMDLIFEASLGCIAFWDLIAKQIHLVELKLGDIYIQSENVDAFITICSRLRSLSLDEIVLDGMLDNAGLPVFPIRDLSLINMRRQENNLLLFSNKCPDLETFHCVSYSNRLLSESFWHSFSVSAASGTWPRLESLSLCNSLIFDKDLATILTSMPHIQELNAYHTKFGELAFAALRPHLKTVTKLNLERCRNITPDLISEIHQSTPNMNPQDFVHAALIEDNV